MNLKLVEKERYQEIDIMLDDTVIGRAEIELKDHSLSRIEIFEPYQNKGYGTEAVKQLLETYKCNKDLWVREDNKRAIHVYEKFGFKIAKVGHYIMEREE